MSRVLVVEDEQRIANFISRALTAEGFVVDTAGDGARGLELAQTGGYDLVVLDLRLPGLDGASVLRGIMQADPEQPVVVLSALSDARVRVRCLELGASDYVAKPFELAELVLRIKARLRHSSSNGAPAARLMRTAKVTLDIRRLTADVGSGPIRLSPREFHVLEHLVESSGSVCTREELLSSVWSYTFDPGTNVVDVYIGRLRAKLGPGVIETVRNVGYSLAA